MICFGQVLKSWRAYGTFFSSQVPRKKKKKKMVWVCWKKKAHKPNRTPERWVEASLGGCSHTEAALNKNSTQIIQHRPSLDAFVIAWAALPRKEKGKEKKSGPWWWPRGTDRQQKEKLFGLWATKTKDRMRLCFMSTLTDKSTCTCAHKKPTTTRSQHGLDLSAKGYSLNSRHYKVMICRQALLKPTELYLKF